MSSATGSSNPMEPEFNNQNMENEEMEALARQTLGLDEAEARKAQARPKNTRKQYAPRPRQEEWKEPQRVVHSHTHTNTQPQPEDEDEDEEPNDSEMEMQLRQTVPMIADEMRIMRQEMRVLSDRMIHTVESKMDKMLDEVRDLTSGRVAFVARAVPAPVPAGGGRGRGAGVDADDATGAGVSISGTGQEQEQEQGQSQNGALERRGNGIEGGEGEGEEQSFDPGPGAATAAAVGLREEDQASVNSGMGMGMEAMNPPDPDPDKGTSPPPPPPPPAYELSRTVGTVTDLFREWTEGLAGRPSVEWLNATYGAAWRATSKKMFYSRRNVIITEIAARAREQ